jgi:DNA invertase Pin-like site-specific DNA recombinase
MARKKVPAFAYLRTSSAANVGVDKDSHTRQQEAIERFARGAGFEIVGEFYDAAVSGADAVDVRPGFAEMLERIAEEAVRTIIVETANRFARDLIVQETGHKKLRELGIELIAADSPDSFVVDTPTAVMVRQILGAVAQFEKAALVAKLRTARGRAKRTRGKCEGRKSLVELHPGAVALAKRLRRASTKRGRAGEQRRMSLRAISTELAAAGHVNERGVPFNHLSIAKMVGEAKPRA